MSQPIRMFDGKFGRLQLLEAAARGPAQPGVAPQVVVMHEAAGLDIRIDCGQAKVLVFQASAAWLHRRFPAVFDGDGRPIANATEAVNSRIRQVADTLVVEVLNDQFLSHERLEFMLQELVLSVVEVWIAGRASGARLWRGSPFADNRIRKALALLRAHPNKELNMNELASRVGLSRSRFYDLFQLSTGRSPRAYLDMLCIASAISKLSTGSGKIADVSAELGFSAQSNFTRFFQQQFGIPPSEYRRAARPGRDPKNDPGE